MIFLCCYKIKLLTKNIQCGIRKAEAYYSLKLTIMKKFIKNSMLSVVTLIVVGSIVISLHYYYGVYAVMAFFALALILLKVWKVADKEVEKSGADYILWVVEHADKSHQGKEIKAVSAKIHLVPKALKIVADYGNLGQTYAKAIFEKYGNFIPFEIEKAVIEMPDTCLCYYFSDNGILWSEKAQKLMKEVHPTVYLHNVKKTRDDLFYFLTKQHGNYFDAEQFIGAYEMHRYLRNGFIAKVGDEWQITEYGSENAATCVGQAPSES